MLRPPAKEFPFSGWESQPPEHFFNHRPTSTKFKKMAQNELQIRTLLEEWANATREGRLDEVLKNHSADLVIFDVLPPLQYSSAAAYRKSWGTWQPETQGEARFEIENLSVTAGDQVAFAHGIIQCGGTQPDGQVFSDTVRATFCLQKSSGTWKVVHQHVSKPFSSS